MNLQHTHTPAPDENRASVRDSFQWGLLKQLEFDFAFGLSAKTVSVAKFTRSVTEASKFPEPEQAAPVQPEQAEGAPPQPCEGDEESAVKKTNEAQSPRNNEADNIGSNPRVVRALEPYQPATEGVGFLMNIVINILLGEGSGNEQ